MVIAAALRTRTCRGPSSSGGGGIGGGIGASGSNSCLRSAAAAVSWQLRRGLERRRGRLRRAVAGMASDAATEGNAAVLESVRKHMRDMKISAFIVPSADPHQSEYAPLCLARRQFVSGFTGSAGTAVVFANGHGDSSSPRGARLWTDGRYFLQAEKELTQDWTLMKMGVDGVPDVKACLASVMPAGSVVGIDPELHTVSSANELKEKLKACGVDLAPVPSNPVDEAWREAGTRPTKPEGRLRLHCGPDGTNFAGATVAEKLALVREIMAGKVRADGSTAGPSHGAADVLLVTMVDELMWLFNVRGCDVPYNPVAMCYGMVHKDKAVLYIDACKVEGEELSRHFEEAGVTIKAYESVFADLEAAAASGKTLWLDPDQASIKTYWCVQEGLTSHENKSKAANKRRRTSSDAGSNGTGAEEGTGCVQAPSPISHLKSIKNAVEIEWMREAHLRDGAALAEFWLWLETKIAAGEKSSEVEVDEKLIEFRKKQPGFIEPSFPTIAGADGNGAIIHYRASASSSKEIDATTMLLVDSGAQFDCGTTDITRTVHFGTPTAAQRNAFTRVLKGHIALDAATFPENTPGFMLDILARQYLWGSGLDYRHGTGHGVGAGLNVHEGPQSISPRFNNATPLRAGMIVSNEPGYYEDNGFGVRIENLILIEEQRTEYNFGGKAFLGFSPLTFVPMDAKLIDPELLSADEVAWIDSYHALVWEKVSPRVEGKVADWLKARTRPLAELLQVAAV